MVEADISPSGVLNAWKAYATRSLRSAGLAPPDRILWTHGGSVNRIIPPDGLTHSIRYVLEGQGEPMELYCADSAR
jgi:hypothetical protein